MGDKKNIFCSVENIIREKESRSASEERTLEEFSRNGQTHSQKKEQNNWDKGQILVEKY